MTYASPFRTRLANVYQSRKVFEYNWNSLHSAVFVRRQVHQIFQAFWWRATYKLDAAGPKLLEHRYRRLICRER